MESGTKNRPSCREASLSGGPSRLLEVMEPMCLAIQRDPISWR
jgi:hypothetical protein